MNEQGEESHVSCDNDDDNGLTTLEERTVSISSVYEPVSMINVEHGLYVFITYWKSYLFLYKMFKYMSQDWKKGKSLKYIRTGFITFSKWKLESIGSSMRSMNKNGK